MLKVIFIGILILAFIVGLGWFVMWTHDKDCIFYGQLANTESRINGSECYLKIKNAWVKKDSYLLISISESK